MKAKAMDFSSGLPADKESVVMTKPAEPFWAENLMFTLYCPKSDLGFWLHLGTVPTQWEMWEDRVFMTLPGDEGLLQMWAYHYTAPERKPAGSNLAFKCIEPFKRWKITFDGFAQHIKKADMHRGLAPDSARKRLIIDLDIECACPVWDAHAAAHSKGGKGEMTTQGWAKEHYEQLFWARGRVQVDTKSYEIDGSGWRDHSRGPRGGGGGEPWGGHTVCGAVYPSGKSFIFSSFYRPDGSVSLAGACVTDANGVFHHGEVLQAPRLTELVPGPERVPFSIRWDGGQFDGVVNTGNAIWMSMAKGLAIGKDLDPPGMMYLQSFGSCEWDGEIGYPHLERSNFLNPI